MGAAFNPNPTPAPAQPKCPHCKSPCVIQMNATSFGPVPVAVFVCRECQTILNICLVPPAPGPQRVDARSIPLIVRPS